MECLGMVVIVPPTTAFHVAALATMAAIVHRLLIDSPPERPLSCPLSGLLCPCLAGPFPFLYLPHLSNQFTPNGAVPFTLCLV